MLSFQLVRLRWEKGGVVPNLAVVASSSLTVVGRADRDCLESRLEWQLDQLPLVAMGGLVSCRRLWEKGGEGLFVARVVSSSSSSSLASAWLSSSLASTVEIA